ncbi:MAG: alpha-amylase family glycosyl hydrolase [Woeseiaceae bacterium]|nr:alpha-amylase family glycosyl hydrolase [Woeseiaceae bacterium]
MTTMQRVLLIAACILVAGCPATPLNDEPTATSATEPAAPAPEYYGTLEPFASEAVYFALTDRFVDGDPDNNYVDQGGAERGTFDRPIQIEGEPPANIGYLGGDFQGLLDNAEYIAEMGFTALWITPIVDNPDEAFTGGIRPGEGFGADRGKTGYHGYWGVNFFVEDEHLVSPGVDFAAFASGMSEEGIKIVLDVVANHGSPAYTMPEDQPKYGELYGADGSLIADHQNLHPNDLDPNNPLHAFFNTEPDLAQLADMNETNPDVLDYFVSAHTSWLEKGGAAFRIDTIKHMPHSFWQAFAERVRETHPDLFMFAESYSFDAAEIAQHTWPENGGISVLDFPGVQTMNAVFADGGSYSSITDYLHLDSGLYQNPYELMTFYDNHDMARMNADDNGFIDAHNWIFTSRGIPVIYYGSEIGFRAGTREHGGNRDYFGQENVDAARGHRIRTSLMSIANVRKSLPALQRGLQVNLEFTEDTAAFYRVYRHGGESQTALVLLNKGDDWAEFDIDQWSRRSNGRFIGWVDAETGSHVMTISGPNQANVLPHGVRVLVAEWVPEDPDVVAELDRLQRSASR